MPVNGARENGHFEQALGAAVRRGALELEYRPVVTLMATDRWAGGAIAQVDTALRWRYPPRGVVGQAEILDHAHRLGVLAELSAWYAYTVLANLRLWRARMSAHRELVVAISLGADQLDDQLPDIVADALARAAMPAPALLVQIAQADMVEPAAAALGSLERLRRLGVGLAIDDFAAGPFDLSLLHRLGVGYLKVDRRQLSAPIDEVAGWVIERTLVQLGHGLGIKLIAKRVADSVDAQRLARHGFDLAQGNFYSKPLGRNGITALLRSQHERHRGGRSAPALDSG